ncbi:hypothetical protein NFJ02_09g139270 [Pycnococcus provasolii]
MVWGAHSSAGSTLEALPPSWLQTITDALDSLDSSQSPPPPPLSLTSCVVLPSRTLSHAHYVTIHQAVQANLLTNLTEIVIPRGPTDENSARCLAAIIASSTSLLAVKVGCSLISDAVLACILTDGAANAPSVKDLTISGPGNAANNTWCALADAIKNNKNIESVTMEGHDDVDETSMAPLANALAARNSALSTLDVSACTWTDPNGTKQLGVAAKSIKHLVANHCNMTTPETKVGDCILSGVVSALDNTATLVSLSLRDSGASDDAIKQLFDALGSEHAVAPSLAQFDFARCQLGVESLVAIGTCARKRHAQSLPALQLDVSDNERVDDDAVSALADANMGEGICALDVSGKTLSERGACAAARAVGSIGSRLCVNGAKLGAGAAVRLLTEAKDAGWLTSCTQLRACECDIDTETLAAVAEVVRGGALPALTTLELGGNPCIADIAAEEGGESAKDAVEELRACREGIDIHVRAA